MAELGTMRVKGGLAEMLKGGVIMDVTTAEQARIAEEAGAVGGIRRLGSLREDELYSEAKNLQAPVELVQWVAEHGRLPVVTFTAGGIATPADAALCMQLGADGVFIGSGIFKSADPSTRAKAIVQATTHYRDADVLARRSHGLGDR